MAKIERSTVDLTEYPDLVVIYLGMRMNKLSGMKRIIQLGPEIQQSVAAKPDGLLCHEQFFFSFFPPHAGMRQYWRDFESLEQWVLTLPHQKWWKEFLRDPGRVGFWHELYSARGFEAIYDNMTTRPGLSSFANLIPARGPMFRARSRMNQPGEAPSPAMSETELYG